MNAGFLIHLTSTVNPVTVTIGGVAVPVHFALTPRFAGLYQVNAMVPDGVPPALQWSYQLRKLDS